MLLMLVWSCSGNEDGPISGEEITGKEILVSLNVNGEFNVEQGEESIETRTRAVTDDVYGINVYYNKDKGDKYVIYGYGLFDDKSAMNIKLLSGYKYKFTCTLVKNGKNTLYYGQAFGNTYSGFAYPFQTGTTTSTMLENKFITGTSSYLTGIGSGATHIKGTNPTKSNASSYASVNRFYGETTDYVPTEGGTVNIDLKRVVFGAKFVIKGVKDGTLTASCGGFWNTETTTDNDGVETIYTFADVRDCWANETPLSTTLSISYDNDHGTGLDMSKSHKLTFKRNVLTTVTINLDLPSSTFTLTEEPLGEDNIINVGINADGFIDTEVKPEEE